MAANVLLEIATKTDFASLAALKDMVLGTVGAIRDWIAVNERFVQQMDNATISISGMEKNVANLIDTGLAYQQTTELTNAGLDATSDQFAAVAKAATVFGKTTGDVNGEFTKLINALKTGRTEGLKKYGIEIEATGDRQKDFEKAVEQLTERFKDHKVELETTQEVMSSLSNNWGTLQGQVLKLTGLNEPLISGFRRLNDELAEASGNLDKMITAMERYDSIKKRVEDRSDLALADPYGGMDEALSRMRTKRMIEMVARSQDAIDQWQREQVSDFLNERGDYASDISEMSAQASEDAIARMLAAGEFTTSVPTPGKSSRRRGGKSAAEIEAERIAEERRRTDELLSGYGAAEMPSFGAEDRAISYQEDIEYRRQLLDIQLEQARIADATGEAERAILEQRIELITELAELKRAELDALGYDKDSPEYRQTRLELAQLEHEQFVAQKETEIELANEWGNAWVQALGEFDAEAHVTNSTVRMFSSSMRSAMNAMLDNRSVIKSIGEVLKNQGRAVAIESTIQAMLELGRGIAAQAMTWGSPNPKSIAHMAAAGQLFATAAVAGGVGGIGAAMSRSGNRSQAASAPAGAEAIQRPEPRNQTTRVELVLEGDDDMLIESMLKVNGRRARAGERHLAEG